MSLKGIVSYISKFLIVVLVCSGCSSKTYNIDFYFVKTCPVCKAMQEDIIDNVQSKYGRLVKVKLFDIDEEVSIERYALTCSMLDDYYVNDESGHVPLMVVDGYFAKVGYDFKQKDELLQLIDDVINQREIQSDLNEFYRFKDNMRLYKEGL